MANEEYRKEGRLESKRIDEALDRLIGDRLGLTEQRDRLAEGELADGRETAIRGDSRLPELSPGAPDDLLWEPAPAVEPLASYSFEATIDVVLTDLLAALGEAPPPIGSAFAETDYRFGDSLSPRLLQAHLDTIGGGAMEAAAEPDAAFEMKARWSALREWVPVGEGIAPRTAVGGDLRGEFNQNLVTAQSVVDFMHSTAVAGDVVAPVFAESEGTGQPSELAHESSTRGDGVEPPDAPTAFASDPSAAPTRAPEASAPVIDGNATSEPAPDVPRDGTPTTPALAPRPGFARAPGTSPDLPGEADRSVPGLSPHESQSTDAEAEVSGASEPVLISDPIVALNGDVGPIKDANVESALIPESISNGDPIGITAQATDPDGWDTVSFALSDDAGGRFAIDAATGVVTVADASLLDYETAASHTIEVTATSTDGSTSTQQYTIGLTDHTAEAAVGAVTDADAGAAEISESSANGDAVGITAQAADADGSDTVSYALSADAGGRFAIDASTGVVTVADASSLDYETAASHTIEVTATSSDGSTSTQSYTVALTDDTSEATVGAISDADGAAAEVSESASDGDAVGITAQAADADGSDTVSYALSADAGGRFAIDTSTGVVTVADASLLDYETAASHTIEVTATSSDGSTSTQSYTVALTDDASESAVSAISDADGAVAEVSESAVNGDTVGITAQAADADGSDTVSYALSDDAGGRFAIDATTGVVTVADASLLDYEAASSHMIEVTATSSDGSTSTQSYTVTLADDTSEATVGAISDADGAAAEVSESASDGDAVGITAQAADADGSDTVSYALSDDAGGRFAIDASTGVVTVADASLLDYETAASHTIEVTATSSDGSTSTQSYTISLTDDTSEATVSAVTDADAGAAEVSESAVNGDTVGITAQADDADGSDTVSYALSDDAGGRFAIDASTGVVTVADASLLDYETAASHTIEVTATSSDGSTSTQSYTITLTDDASESAVSAISDADGAAAEVSESSANGDTVGITAQAADADESDTVSFALSDDAGGRFAIDATTGVVTVADASLLDYESAPSHTIQVTATSSDGSTSTQSYTITLTDDASESAVSAISDADGAAAEVSESSANGDMVGITAQAADADGTDTVSYALSDDAGGRFAIDATTGVVTVADASLLDYESASNHTIEVTATSSDGSTSTQTYTITLTDDASESAVSAISDADGAAAEVSESASDGDAVGITAQAADADGSDTVSYALSDDAGGRFTIDASTGVVTVVDASLLDYESASSYTIEVTATSSDGSTSTQQYTIQLTDDTGESTVNAVTDADGAAAEISESVANGAAVGITAQAADADGTDTVSYALSDDAGGRFAIDATSGVVTVADASRLDYESETSHTIEVTATSSDGSTSTQQYTVALTDTNEAPTGLTALAPDDTYATAVTLLEPVAYLRFSGGNALDGVGGHHGQMMGGASFAADGPFAGLGHEALRLDGGGEHVRVENDGSFATSEGSATLWFRPDSTAGMDYLLDLNADGNGSEGFSIRRNGNRIHVNTGQGALYSDPGSVTADEWHQVTLTWDGDGTRLYLDDELVEATPFVLPIAGNTRDIVIGANDPSGRYFEGDIAEFAWFDRALDAGDVAALNAAGQTAADVLHVPDSAAGGTLVALLDAVDPDAADAFSFEIVDEGGVPIGHPDFEIVGNELRLRDDHTLDAESVSSVTLDIRAEDSAGESVVETISVTVLDGPETSIGAVTDSDGAPAQVSEFASNGDTVGITAQALDPDASDTVSYALSDDAGGRFAIDASTGVVTVADASLIDYESAANHTIEVIATSSDGSTSTQSYTIDVLDEAEASGLPDLPDRPAMPTPPATGNTISGGNGSQTLFGSNANDTIYGGNHDDALYGNGGDDRLYGQNHDDRLHGGTGDDWLEGGNHEDELHGGTDDDVLLGGQHDDQLHGGTGDDWLEGGHHDDLLEGDTGNDVLLGGHHEDILRGGSGDDWLEGGHHADVLEGGDGNDVLWGGVGSSDQMEGGAGDDFFLFREGDGDDFAHGGVGWTDVIQLQDDSGGDPASGWTVQLDAGSVVETGADFMRFSADADGSITLADGSRLDFVDIEALQW